MMTSFEMSEVWGPDTVLYRELDPKYIYHKSRNNTKIDTYQVNNRNQYAKLHREYFDSDDIFLSDWQIGQLSDFNIVQK